MVWQQIASPLRRFISTETGGGVVLLAATLTSLLWCNLAPAHFDQFWHTPLGFQAGKGTFQKPLEFWLNDGLMAVFFLVVGLEIKRELTIGSLNTFKTAALPFAAALGGMLVPALIFVVFNHNTLQAKGWAIPMATDIAFALGVLSLAGKRVPLALKVFLMAFAIVDDLGAVVVIALFYSGPLQMGGVFLAGIAMAGLLLANRLRFRHLLVYLVGGVALWLGVWQSGIHATIAGVLLAMVVPTYAPLNLSQFLKRTEKALAALHKTDAQPECAEIGQREQQLLHAIEQNCERLLTPSQRLEFELHPWVSFGIMPLFALANAGILFSGESLSQFAAPPALGIFLGLVLGKPIGIMAGCWLAMKTGLASMARGFSWQLLAIGGVLGGLGFTMSVFVAGLAFPLFMELQLAKAAILVASLVAGISSSILLRMLPFKKRKPKVVSVSTSAAHTPQMANA